MIRFLHLVAITLLIGSAAYAYSTKYETLYYAETLTKLRAKVQRERETIAIAKAEWALLTRPDRLQRMVDRHLDLQPMAIAQLARLSDLPVRPFKADAIGAKLETLGMEPETTGSTKERRPAKRDASGPAPNGVGPTPNGVGPTRDPIGAKLDSLLASGSAAPKPTSAPRPSPKPPAR